MDIAVARHPHPAVLIASFCVENLEVSYLELLPDLEQLRSHCRIDYRRLQHSGKHHRRRCILDHSSRHLLSLVPGIVLTFILAIRVLTSKWLTLFLGWRRLFLFPLKLLLKLFNDLKLVFVSLAENSLNFSPIPNDWEFVQPTQHDQPITQILTKLKPLINAHKQAFPFFRKYWVRRLYGIGQDIHVVEEIPTSCVFFIVL